MRWNKSLAMGRKRNQGKARRAAKAKAREEAYEGVNNNQAAGNSSEEQSSLAVQMRHLQIGDKCRHDPNPNRYDGPAVELLRLLAKFHSSFVEGFRCGNQSLWRCLMAAKKATLDEFSDKWNDSAKMEIAEVGLSFFYCEGTEFCLRGDYDDARDSATFARFFEQYIAVEVKRTQALYNPAKINETYYSDVHTLVKFFRHRIPCSCLDEKYEEVKDVPKMGCCYNPECKLPNGMTERSNTKYCSRCRCATYCSRECQEVDWSRHKAHCDCGAAVIAKFEAKRQE